MRFKFIFCSKRMKTIQAIKTPLCFEVIPCNNADNFFTARYCHPSVSSIGISKRIICFSQFELIFET